MWRLAQGGTRPVGKLSRHWMADKRDSTIHRNKSSNSSIPPGQWRWRLETTTDPLQEATMHPVWRRSRHPLAPTSGKQRELRVVWASEIALSTTTLALRRGWAVTTWKRTCGKSIQAVTVCSSNSQQKVCRPRRNRRPGNADSPRTNAFKRLLRAWSQLMGTCIFTIGLGICRLGAALLSRRMLFKTR